MEQLHQERWRESVICCLYWSFVGTSIVSLLLDGITRSWLLQDDGIAAFVRRAFCIYFLFFPDVRWKLLCMDLAVTFCLALGHKCYFGLWGSMSSKRRMFVPCLYDPFPGEAMLPSVLHAGKNSQWHFRCWFWGGVRKYLLQPLLQMDPTQCAGHSSQAGSLQVCRVAFLQYTHNSNRVEPHSKAHLFSHASCGFQ